MKQFYITVILFFSLQFCFGQIGIQNIITEEVDGPTNVISADLDNDGDLDMVSISASDRTIAWFENLDGLGEFGEKQIIYQDANNFPIRKALLVYDMDNDGDLDVLTAVPSPVIVYGTLLWYENRINEGFSFWASKTINSNIGASFMRIADINNDGVDDIVSNAMHNNYNSDKLVWLKKTETGTEYTVTTIDESGDNLLDVTIGDIDNDGDLDVVAMFNYSIYLYKNLDGVGSDWEKISILNEYNYNRSIDLVDIDNDGDNDILFGSSTDDKIAWFENTNGLDSFDVEHVITTTMQIAHPVDFDSDGDIDILCAGQYPGVVMLYKNIDGLGNFNNGQIILNNLLSVSSFHTSDINDDGILDIVVASVAYSWNDVVIWADVLGAFSNEIYGLISFDLDNNGCDVDDIALPQILIEATDGVNTLATFSDTNGNFNLFTNEGQFITSVPQLPNYFISNPSTYTHSFDGNSNTEIADFCIKPIGEINDLNIAIYPSQDDPRPGFNTTYQLVYNNMGTTQLSGSVAYEFDDSKLNFISANEAITSQTTNTLNFDFTDLNPFETRTIDLEFNVFAPPTTNIDDVLISTATVNPVSGDETEEDNVFTLEQTVIGSYDPNDITVLEGDQITIEEADKYLHFLLRFQNTGTASAINVRVDHVLDPKLDWTTMQLENLSHTGRVEIIDETDVSFIFNNINLADSTNDEPNSHGFIAFKIKPKSNVQVGDVFSAVADIYFDFNPPIITNTVNTQIVEPLSVDDFNKQTVQLYPNPTTSILEIKSNQSIDKIFIVDINGRLLKEINLSNLNYDLDVSNLTKGVYFLELQSSDSKLTKKFIKN
ncbi:T9SS type A sorting domain-containing protein [Winogradskyella ludwigii]|uniref:T9SS type A sorting domain-containing protein n=1 Tax=Winogradskyella ludwigii TaxID=2686076 RepID=UPI0015CD407B|nr:T9SS type A sorting domain-containing protein [Winogradskyella ludwigii]